MRAIMLLPFLVLAGCSESSPPAEKTETATAEHIKAGQWQMTSEVTKVTPRDKGAPAIKMPVGSKTTSETCVAEADTKKLTGAMFAPEGLTCEARDSYARGGRINSTYRCSGAGLSGDVAVAVNGSYTADTIEATSTIETRLTGDGDQGIETKITGRRTGDCTAAPAKS